MNVFVTGATGAIGRPAVRALIANGHSVSAMARTPANAKLLQSVGATPVFVSLFDRTGLSAAFAGQDAIVNLATALPATRDFRKISAWQENIRIRKEGSATVVDAALDAGVSRLLQESVSMIYRDQGDAWIDESCPTDDFPMAQSNLAAEKSLCRFNDAGGTGITLRFGWFYGLGATHSEQFLRLARKWGVCMMMGGADTYVSSIHVADGGAAVESLLRAPSGIYNIVDDEPLTKRAYADAIAAATGRERYLRLPGRLAQLLGDNTTSLTRSLRVGNAKIRQLTNWSPSYPSAYEGWQSMAAN